MADDLPPNHSGHQHPTEVPQARALPLASTMLQGTVLINRKQLLQKVPLSERTIYDMEKRNEFPQRFAISARHVAWDLREVDQWIERQRQNAAQPTAPGRVMRRK